MGDRLTEINALATEAGAKLTFKEGYIEIRTFDGFTTVAHTMTECERRLRFEIKALKNRQSLYPKE